MLLVTLQLNFDNVLAEPNGWQGFEFVWLLAMKVFKHTKIWFYKIFAALVALPAAFIWAILFSLLTLYYIWFICPMLRLFDFFLAIFRRVS